MKREDEILEALDGFAKNHDFIGLRQLMSVAVPTLFCQTVKEIGAHEGSIWLLDSGQQELVICYNTEDTGWHVRQPLSSGLISKAYKEERPVHQKGIKRYEDASELVDQGLYQRTQHQISIPFYVCGRTCGVLSVVQLSSDFHSDVREDVPWGFKEDAIPLLEAMGTVIAESIEANWQK